MFNFLNIDVWDFLYVILLIGDKFRKVKIKVLN